MGRKGENVGRRQKEDQDVPDLVITAAVIIGFIYYFHDVKGSHGVNEGTLVKKTVYYQDEKTEVKKDGREGRHCIYKGRPEC